jgi:YHYH protein
MKRNFIPRHSAGLFLMAALVADFGICGALAQAVPPDASKTNRVSITIEGDRRVIRANGLPDHETGRFPNRGNPNTIAAQNYVFRVPAKPKMAATARPVGMQPFGVAINGVVFDPAAAEWWNRDRSSGWQYEPLTSNVKLGVDQNNAHVQPTGAYHYHGLPTGLLSKIKGAKERMVLLGWAADGFPIYAPWGYSNAKDAKSALKPLKSSYRIKKGTRPSGPGGAYDGSFVADWEYVVGAGDLDECNGRVGVTPEFPEGTYHYYLTSDFPFIPRLYRGTPDQSFERHGPPGGGPGNRRPGGPQGPPP